MDSFQVEEGQKLSHNKAAKSVRINFPGGKTAKHSLEHF